MTGAKTRGARPNRLRAMWLHMSHPVPRGTLAAEISSFFIMGDILMTGRLLSIGAFAIFDRLRRKPYVTNSYQPRVAVLIPAFNEEKVIEQTVRAALASDYRDLRVIVIDDGSSDRTLEIA